MKRQSTRVWIRSCHASEENIRLHVYVCSNIQQTGPWYDATNGKVTGPEGLLDVRIFRKKDKLLFD